MSRNKRGEPSHNARLFDTEIFISSSLRFGVYLSAAVIALGLIFLFSRGSSGYPADVFPTTLKALWSGLLQFKPDAFISLGLLFLIATPVFRVAASVILFLVEKDRLYTLITLFVLAVLVTSFLLGQAL